MFDRQVSPKYCDQEQILLAEVYIALKEIDEEIDKARLRNWQVNFHGLVLYCSTANL